MTRFPVSFCDGAFGPRGFYVVGETDALDPNGVLRRNRVTAYDEGGAELATIEDGGRQTLLPSVTYGPGRWAATFQLQSGELALWNEFGLFPLGLFTAQQAAVRWTGAHYLVACVTDRGTKKRVVAFDERGRQLQVPAPVVVDAGNDRWCRGIRPDGSAVWNGAYPAREHASLDGSVVCREGDAETEVFFDGDRSQALYLPPSMMPTPFPLSDGRLYVLMRRGGQLHRLAPPFLLETYPRPQPPPAIVPIGKPFWFGWFEEFRTDTGTGQPLDHPDAPANVTQPNGPAALQRALAAGRFVVPHLPDLGLCAGAMDRVPYVYVHDEGSYAGLAAQCRPDLPRPAITYSGFHNWYVPGTVHGIQCYFAPGTTVAQVRTYVRDELARSPAPRIALIWQAYDRSTWTDVDAIAAFQPVMTEAVAADSRIEAVLIFSWGRPGGARQYPVLSTLLRRVFATVTGRPQIVIDPPPPPPPPDEDDMINVHAVPHDVIGAVHDWLRDEIYTPEGKTPPNHVPHPLDTFGAALWLGTALVDVLARPPLPGSAADWAKRVEEAKRVIRVQMRIDPPQ